MTTSVKTCDEKVCFKCNTLKPLSEFYKHKTMKDGHLGKCKACKKSDALKHRAENIDRIRAYDRRRGNRQTAEYLRRRRKKYPQQYKAQSIVNNAIRDGRLNKETVCSQCDSQFRVHAHHDDYANPLSVRWLCAVCHAQWHRDNGEGANRAYGI